MCGIYAYVGKRDPAKTCLQGLKALEYRGYDSSGIAGISHGKLLFRKEIGKISSLEDSLLQEPMPLHLAIAHTRWATHGRPSVENAHPQFDSSHSIAVVHNGIIENHRELREMLIGQGVRFASDTDTEVVAQLVAHFYRGHLLDAVFEALSHLRGLWALSLIHRDHPDQIIAAAHESSLAIGAHPGREETFISSDASAFHADDLDVLFLGSGEVASISSGRVEVFNQAKVAVAKATERLDVDRHAISKNGFQHFMLKEICEQPYTIQQAFHQRLSWESGSAAFEQLALSHDELKAIQKVVIIGCGTSWHAGLIAASFLEEYAQLSAQAEVASEFRYRRSVLPEQTLVIAISQSGETFDTIAAARAAKERGAKVLAICNRRSSTLTRDADATILLRAGPEISVCSTKAFTSQLTVLFLFALLMGRLRGLPLDEGALLLQELQELPRHVEALLLRREEIQKIARKYGRYADFFFLGRHYMFPTALESALKLKEISYLHATGYPAGEMKHGPIALVDPELAIVGLCGNAHTLDKMLSNLAEMKARGAPLLLLAPATCAAAASLADDWIPLPELPDALAPVLYTIACQLLSYFIALEKGTDIDQPRNLAKSVTVE